MKNILAISVMLLAVSCAKQAPAHHSEEQFLSENEMEVSKNRTKQLNALERVQIEDWIKSQDKKFYTMGMNYWINIENLDHNPRKTNGEKVSYQYFIYDFDNTQLYQDPIKNIDAELGHFKELDAVEDAVRYMKKGEEAELLVPSVLAYGTYGDNKKITNDVPLIIKLKIL